MKATLQHPIVLIWAPLRSRTAVPARLLLMLLLVVLPVAAQAQFNYATNDGVVTITGFTGPGDSVTIPSTMDGLPVVRIGNYAFEFTSLTNVTIPDSVTSIGYSAFGGCTSFSRLHESGQSQLVSGANQHPHRRLVLFQRSAVGESSPSFLSPPLAVMGEEARSSRNAANRRLISSRSTATSEQPGSYLCRT